jgi:Flp pilus assembly protein TadD
MSATHPRADDLYRAGLTAADEGRHAEAIAAFEDALRESPNDSRMLFALGNAAAATGHSDTAENCYRRVLEEEPDRLEALLSLANLLRSRGRTEDMLALVKPAAERNPLHSELWLTLGSALREAGDSDTAEQYCREALRLAPGNAAALGDLAELLADRGAVDDALDLYLEAIALAPDNSRARFNRALLLLAKGKLRAGWRDYEYRHGIEERAPIPDLKLPVWAGRPAEGMSLLVTTEEDIGDQVMFASLIPGLAELCVRVGGHLILETEPRLAPLFARSFAGASIARSRSEKLGGRASARYGWLKAWGGADAYIAMGSLPRLMRRELSDFPAPYAYLVPDENERDFWSDWFGRQGGGPYVGICWRSGGLDGVRNRHYAPLAAWADFIRAVPSIPVSLQYDARKDEIEALQQMSGRTILIPPELDQEQEIDGTAAMLAALDGVVSAPSPVSWIAAGLGVPTLKIRHNASWTSLGCDYEPFAPSARCIAPGKSGDWADAFAKAGAVLKGLPRRG